MSSRQNQTFLQNLIPTISHSPHWSSPSFLYKPHRTILLMKKINVVGTQITIINVENQEFISLTDMLKAKDGDFFISDWLRNRNTVEFLGIWERINNPEFNYGEFATIRNNAGLNNYKISVKEWVEKTNAIGLKATAGRYGGTYAHKDIAFEFGMWISAEFKIYLIKEFQRLKEEESERKQLGWDIKRNLAKINYKIHTEAIRKHLIPEKISRSQENLIYATEADILNLALFCMTAKEWRENNPSLEGNLRDYANVSQLVCLANLENFNALFIKEGIDKDKRLEKLNVIAIEQMTILTQDPRLKLI